MLKEISSKTCIRSFVKKKIAPFSVVMNQHVPLVIENLNILTYLRYFPLKNTNN